MGAGLETLGAGSGSPSKSVGAAVEAEAKARATARVAQGLREGIDEIRTTVARLWTLAMYGYSYRYRLSLIAFLSLVLSVPRLLTPLVMRSLIDQAYPARDFRLFGWLCAALLLLRVLPSAIGSVSAYWTTYVNSMLQYKLCLRVFNAIQRLPQSYREEHGSGMFLERATRDVGTVAGSITGLLPEVVTIVFTFLAAIPLMLRLDVRITLLVLAIVPVNYVITVCLSRRLKALQEVSRKIDEKITTFTSETIEGATVARVFALGRLRRQKLKQLLRSHLSITFASWRATTFWGQLNGAVGMVWGMALLCGGWYLVFTDRLQLGQAVALGMYVSVVARPFQEVGRLYQTLIRNSVAVGRVVELLNARHAVAGDEASNALAGPPRSFELRGVSFGYREGRTCLCDLDLSLTGGKTVALIGPSGAGKSTLVRILSGLDDRYKGQFTVNGLDFRRINRDSYLHYVSLVPQTTFFFSDSIRDNLCPDDGSISLESLQHYARILGLEEVIDSAPDGFDTVLGSEGIRFSAGQYQKLAAFRAILKNASILLLDEVTSSMDIESERQLLKGIVILRPRDCTTLLVTHHIAITAEPWIDEIIVMVNGRISERGTCAQLCENGGFYHHWLTLNQGVSLDRAILVDELSGRGH